MPSQDCFFIGNVKVSPEEHIIRLYLHRILFFLTGNNWHFGSCEAKVKLYLFYSRGWSSFKLGMWCKKKLSINLDQRIFSAELQHTAVGRKLVTWATVTRREKSSDLMTCSACGTHHIPLLPFLVSLLSNWSHRGFNKIIPCHFSKVMYSESPIRNCVLKSLSSWKVS